MTTPGDFPCRRRKALISSISTGPCPRHRREHERVELSHCGKEIDLFKKGGGEQLAKQYELPFLGAIPLDPATVIAADRGVPVVSLTENSPARQGFMALADAVIAATEAE
ncbi:MAG: P-loop NTPase [Bilophila wadsworthia]